MALVTQMEPGLRNGRPQGYAPAMWPGKTRLSEGHLRSECSSLLEEDIRNSLVAHNVKKRPRCKAKKRSHGTPRRQQYEPEGKKANETPMGNHNTSKVGNKNSIQRSCRSQFFSSEGLALNKFRVLHLNDWLVFLSAWPWLLVVNCSLLTQSTLPPRQKQ